MIRIETNIGWTLVGHRDHARLAGSFAAHWGNAEFAVPEPRADILVAVNRHDDAWAARDAVPSLTREGRPSAFSRELVGKYSAFEEIDLGDYLAVRGNATEAVAQDNPYAAVIISMHTVDLLSLQMDPRGLGETDKALLHGFIDGQQRRQAELTAALGLSGTRDGDLAKPGFRRAFEFLQACDSLSLAACVRFPDPIPLRHRHPRRDSTLAELVCTPLGDDTYRIDPYPFDGDELLFEAPCREIRGRFFEDEAAFRAAFAGAPIAHLRIRIVR